MVRKTNVKAKKPRRISMRETIDKIHHTVIRIENEHGSAIKAIGEGLNLTNERLDRFEKNVNQRFDVMDRRLSGVEVQVIKVKEDVAEIKSDVAVTKTDVAIIKNDISFLKTDVRELKADVKEIKQNTSHTASMVDNHELRLGAVESSVKEHIEKHA